MRRRLAASAALCAMLAGPALAAPAAIVIVPAPAAGGLPAQGGAGSAAAGKLGEYASVQADGTIFASCTSTNATPSVITCAGNTIAARCIVAAGSAIQCVQPVYFSTAVTGTTGIAISTPYWIDPASVSGSTFKIATSAANALAGTDVATTGTDTLTANFASYLTSASSIIALQLVLTAGDWDCSGGLSTTGVASTAPTNIAIGMNTTVGIAGFDGSGSRLNTTFTTGAFLITLNATRKRFSLSATTPVNMNFNETWTGGATSPTAAGLMSCRRAS